MTKLISAVILFVFTICIIQLQLSLPKVLATDQTVVKSETKVIAQFGLGKNQNTTIDSNRNSIEASRDLTEQCDAAIVTGIKTVNENYVTKLRLLENQFQIKGDLDGVLAVQREINRFKTLGLILGEHVVHFPEELKQAQINQILIFKDAVDTIIDNVIGDLQSKKKRLTTEGNIQQAIETQRAIKLIESTHRGNTLGTNLNVSASNSEVSLNVMITAKREILGKWEAENTSGWKGVIEFFQDGRVSVDKSFYLKQTWSLTDKGILIKYNSSSDNFDLYYYPILKEKIIGKRFSVRWGKSELTARRIE